ncbi:hypothetical protein [Nostoc sp.]|uniref:hypothetical protein n=1 Tax=Nostoc sp. TaxID=1180 RepID=UPI002FFAB2BE
MYKLEDLVMAIAAAKILDIINENCQPLTLVYFNTKSSRLKIRLVRFWQIQKNM